MRYYSMKVVDSCMDFTFKADNNSKFDFEFESLKSQTSFFPSNYCETEIRYHSLRALSDGWSSINTSFTASINGTPQFAFIGFLLTKENISKVSFFDLPAIFIECPSMQRLYLKKVYSFFLEVVSNVDYIYISDPILDGRLSYFSECLYSLNDRLSFDWRTRRLIDLSLDEVFLRSSIRKSYRSLVNKGYRDFVPSIYNSSTITYEFIDDFYQLHKREAGRETRPYSTWLRQFDAVKEDGAFCTGAYTDGELVSAGYFITSDKHCYYGVSASRRDMFSQPVFHSLLWSSILYAKSLTLSVFEVDSNAGAFSSTSYLSEKEEGIRLFKSGFGGSLYPLLIIHGYINGSSSGGLM